MRAALVQRARDGDDEAFTQLVDLDGNRCFAIAFRILRDAERAKDAVQQAYLLAWRELPRLRESERYEVWLYRLLVNACYEEARRNRRWTANVRLLPWKAQLGLTHSWPWTIATHSSEPSSSSRPITAPSS